MQLTIIIWTLVCALVIIAYPFFLFRKTAKSLKTVILKEQLSLESVSLFSFDLQNNSLGWSFSIDIPELTDEVLFDNTLLFYLETQETCLKLPINNEVLGYSANVFKNVGKVYLTFKCLKDGVSNYNAPSCHLKSLKVLMVQPAKSSTNRFSIYNNRKNGIFRAFRIAGVNIHNYEETLGYLSNFCNINFKGHRKNCIDSSYKKNVQAFPKMEKKVVTI